MLIECSFCSTSKSERYVYTECGHLVCINCAALRAGENLQCCSVVTKLNEEVRCVLKQKKDKIMNNLEKQYKYERTEVTNIEFAELQERLKKIENMQNRPRRKYQEDFEPEEKQVMTAEDQELMRQTPINQFYRNTYNLGEPFHQILQSTPIKMILPPALDQKQSVKQQTDSFNPLSHKKQFKTQNPSIKTKDFKANQFNHVFIKFTQSLKEQFKDMHEQLHKIQSNILYQMEVYFEEYSNLIQKQKASAQSYSELGEIQTQRLNNFLNQFVEEWNLADISKVLSEKQDLKQSNYFKQSSKQADYNMNDRRKIIYSNLIEPLRNSCINQPINGRKNEKKDQFLDRIRLSESNQNENRIEPVSYTGRNLTRIYKKLQQSRSKLEERIQIHNEFMSRRCIKLGNY